jgi:hypothetical protein
VSPHARGARLLWCDALLLPLTCRPLNCCGITCQHTLRLWCYSSVNGKRSYDELASRTARQKRPCLFN